MVRLVAALCFVAVAGAVGPASAADPVAAVSAGAVEEVLAGLQERLSTVKTVQTDFVQEKRLAVFDRAIRLRGRILLETAGRLAWHVDSPVRYSLVVAGDAVQQWDEDTRRVQRMSISRNPVLKVVADQLKKWFSGRYAGLSETYTVSVVRRGPAVLAFDPKETAAEHGIIKRVIVCFREDEQYLQEIRIEEVAGDVVCLSFSNTVLNAALPADSWEIRPDAK